jgi:hypothetical protein
MTNDIVKNILRNDNYEQDQDLFNENENENNINRANSPKIETFPLDMNTAENNYSERNSKLNMSNLSKKKSESSKLNNNIYEFNEEVIKNTIENFLDKILYNQRCKLNYK